MIVVINKKSIIYFLSIFILASNKAQRKITNMIVYILIFV